MDVSAQILSDITVYQKYARFNKELNRRETWEEICLRNMQMHINKYPALAEEIKETFLNYVITKKVLPSMRSLQFGGKPIEISPNRIYNCLAEETSFLTADGIKSFRDFNDGDVTTVLSHTGLWQRAVVKRYGEQTLHKLSFTRGRTKKDVWATANHRWLLADGAVTDDIRVGDLLVSTPNTFNNIQYEDMGPEERLAWCYGYVFGDGTTITTNGKKYSQVRLCSKDSSFANRFIEMGFKISSPASFSGDFMAYTGAYDKSPIDPSLDSNSAVKAFVRGYLDADGHKNPAWYSNKQSSEFKGIQASDAEHIEFIRKVFPVAGVHILNEEDLTGQETNFGIRPNTIRFSISTSLVTNECKNNTRWSLKEIDTSNVRKEDVWCLEVDEDHSFILDGGIVTGNCCYLPVDSSYSFSETMFLLLGGTGVGYSVQKKHIGELPPIRKPFKKRRYLIGDSIEGWADSIKVLIDAYMRGKSMPIFDFSDIREKGAPLITSGGKAPGAQPLKDCLHNLQKILDSVSDGDQLTPLQVHDMMCYIADAVLAGGIRRAALICLFDLDDQEMLTCKSGTWWELNPQRGRANNSAVVLRHKVTKSDFDNLWEKIKASGSGEPGIYLTNNEDWGCNPCCEIALRPYQFCNLTEINGHNIVDQDDLNARARAAAFIGTLQAGYTHFHYIRDIWRKTTEKDSLIGVSITGIASGAIYNLNETIAAQVVKEENERVAKIIGINPAARTTCIKPAGTTSCVLGSSSGIHAWHDEYYIRRQRLGKNESLYVHLSIYHPELVEDEFFKPQSQAVVSLPMKAPKGAVLRHESALELLERVKRYSSNWVHPGHRKGDNTHNVSATISIRDDEWDLCREWMWTNRNVYSGLSVLPHDGGSYIQAPFESCTKEKYEELLSHISKVDLTKIVEIHDDTDRQGEIACSGSGCTI